jgi:MFS family permease
VDEIKPPLESASGSTPSFDAPRSPIALSVVAAHPVSAEHPDRSTGLVIFGVFQIILGLLAALMIPMVGLGAIVSRLAPGGGMRAGQFASALATYGFIAGVLIILGIGSVQTRRWAHALTLIISWYWLIVGALVTVLLTAVMPMALRAGLQTQRSLPNAPPAELSTGVMAVIITVIIVFAALFLIVVPLAFVIFYSRSDVAATCRLRDPVERWTDRAPLPILGASVVFLVGALYSLMVGLTAPVFPFFGRYLTGLSGTACFLVLAALDAYLALAFFRLKIVAWWIAVLALPIRVFSMASTYVRANLLQAYSRMGFSDAQLRALNGNPMMRGHVILFWSLISMVLFFGYLLWIRGYFKQTIAEPQSSALPAQAG